MTKVYITTGKIGHDLREEIAVLGKDYYRTGLLLIGFEYGHLLDTVEKLHILYLAGLKQKHMKLIDDGNSLTQMLTRHQSDQKVVEVRISENRTIGVV